MGKRGLAFGILAAGLVYLGYQAVAPQQDNCDDPISAYVDAQHAVRQKLKAPEAARFPMFSSSAVSADKIGGCRFKISAWVDARNDLGGFTRQPWTAIATSSVGATTWRIEEISVGR
ncbi:hypothetical protein [uncultured Brevundimonas sp.]|uniref:hypothetical protein n=1 Tax=uncultured Brevundimonas sp. TaxID=213418 RepID=UPI0025F1713D|nr:hypothetical protein [uncultured Brevundimonas sp.]